LKLDRGADLLDREGCRDGHAELARRDQAGDLLDGAGGGVSAVGRSDPVDLGGDGGDALVRNAEFSCRLRRLDPVQVDGRGDAAGSQGTELLAGNLIVETVFNYEGLGMLFNVSLQNEDYFVLVAYTLLGAVLTVLGNLLADITLMIADPRVCLT
jgi:binding-protein-dependent transport system inner membrane component